MRYPTLATLALVLALSGCGGGDSEPAGKSPKASVTDLEGNAQPSCAEHFKEGAKLTAEDAGVTCVKEDGSPQVYGVTDRECADGRTLYWNDLGWGYSGEPFHRHAEDAEELVAPEAERQACEPDA